jgi:hypothetical protein
MKVLHLHMKAGDTSGDMGRRLEEAGNAHGNLPHVVHHPHGPACTVHTEWEVIEQPAPALGAFVIRCNKCNW